VSELWDTARAAVSALAAGDPRLRRFGASHHRYALAPPASRDAIAALEARLGAALPDELAGFVRELGAGGAGPGYGIVPVDRPDRLDRVTAPPGAPWSSGLPLAHLGCGYLAVVALDGAARGEIWIDARAVGVARAIAPGMTAFYLDWIDRLAHGRWPESQVPPGTCALAAALSSYLGRCEAEHGSAPGTLSDGALRAALARLGPGAIAITADASAWFDDGDRLDPCIACARLIESLGSQGLRSDAVAPGIPPRPLRRGGPDRAAP